MTTGTSRTHDLEGHRPSRLGRSPFGSVLPSVAIALGFAGATLVWVVAGDVLPGGRWLAVHLFTLGVLSMVVLAFSEHFARTVTRSPDASVRGQPIAFVVGALLVLVGVPDANEWLVAAGATITTVVVFVAYLRIRRMRKQAVGARFVWIARMYERAHGAFIHGAVLGWLMGAGILSGSWYLAAKFSHLHINILGWGGMTLLSTLVFFGPTIVRTRIVEGADARSARALKHGATGLSVGVLLLLASGMGGAGGTAFRVAAAAGIALFAWSVLAVCRPVGVAARNAKPSAPRWPLVALTTWFPLLVAVDVVVVATAQWRFLDALGLGMLIGVLGQAIATTLMYLAPMLRGRTFDQRDRLLHRLERGATARVVVYNLGALMVAVAAAVRGDLGDVGMVLARVGWVAVVGALLQLGAAALWPLPRSVEGAGQARSQVTRRYREG